MSNAVGEILEAVTTFFEEEEWPFSQDEDSQVLRMSFTGQSGKWTCFAHVREDEDQFAFFSVPSAKTPSEALTAMAEFLTRANFGLIIGNFELDCEDGEVRFKTSIEVENDRLSPALVRNLVYSNIAAMDRYLPGIMAVILKEASPADAIEMIEG